MSAGRRVYCQWYCNKFSKLFGADVTIVSVIFRHGEYNKKQQTVLQWCHNLGADGLWIMVVKRWLYNSWRCSRLACSSVDCNHRVYKPEILLTLCVVFITCRHAEVRNAWLILAPRQSVCFKRNQGLLVSALVWCRNGTKTMSWAAVCRYRGQVKGRALSY
jgi:hypothetical protein